MTNPEEILKMWYKEADTYFTQGCFLLAPEQIDLIVNLVVERLGMSLGDTTDEEK